MRHVSLLFLAFGLFFSFSSVRAAAPVEVITASRVEGIASREIREFLVKAQMTPVDLTLDPSLPLHQHKIGALVDQMWMPNHGPEKTHVVLVDDMSMNAFFLRLPSGEKLIGLNLGALRYLLNDSEEAVVVSHELKHGPSKLDEYLRAQSSPGSLNLLQRMKHRAVENEVDGMAILEAVIPLGYNPYAYFDLMSRMEETYGDGVGGSHTATASRRHTTGMLVTYLKRRKGQKLPDPGDYSAEMIGPVRAYVTSQKFEAWQRARIAQSMRGIGDPATPFLQSVMQATDPNAVPQKAPYPFARAFHEISPDFRRFGHQILTDQELLDLELELYRRIELVFQRAHANVVPTNFAPITELQFRGYYHFWSRWYQTSVPEIRNAYQLRQEARARIRALEQKLKRELSEDQRDETESLLFSARRGLVYSEHQYELAKYAYDLPVEELEKRLRKIAKSKTRAVREQREAALERKLKVVGRLPLRNERRRAEFADRHFQMLTAEIGPIPLFFKMHLFFALTPERQAQELPAFLETFLRFEEAAPPYWRRMSRGYATINAGELDNYSISGYVDAPTANASQFFAIVQRLRPALYVPAFRRYLLASVRSQTSPVLFETAFTVHDPQAFGMQLTSMLDANADFAWTQGLNVNVNFAQTLFDDSFAEAFLETTNKNFSLLLAKASPDELDRLLKQWSTRLVDLNKYHLLGSPNLQALRLRHVRSQMPAIAAKFRFTYDPEKLLPMTPQQEISYLIVRHPEFYELADFNTDPASYHIAEDLLVLADHPQTVAALWKTIDFLPVIRTIPMNLPNEAVFSFFLKIGKLLRFSFKRLFLDDPDQVPNQIGAYFDQLLASSGTPEADELRIRMRETFEPYKFIEELIRAEFERHAKLPVRERSRRAFEDGVARLRGHWKLKLEKGQHELAFYPYGRSAMGKISEKKSDKVKLQILLGYADALFTTGDEGLAEDGHIGYELLKLLGSERYKKVELQTLLDAWKLFQQVKIKSVHAPSAYGDKIFEWIWEQSEPPKSWREKWKLSAQKRLAVRRRLTDEKLVPLILFDFNKRILARWQLETNYRLAVAGKAYIAGENPRTQSRPVRPLVNTVQTALQTQFPGPTGLRDLMVNEVEVTLHTNSKETDKLDGLRMTKGRWVEANFLAGLDVPHAISGKMQSNHDRLIFIRYLTGRIHELPADFIARYAHVELEILNTKVGEYFEVARAHFIAAGTASRTYVMQPLIDSTNGIFSEPPVTERLINFILGDHAEEPILKFAFKRYLHHLPDSERKVVVGHILASMTDNPKGKASLRNILEAMYAFGQKVAQMMRATGVVKAEHRAELDHVFDSGLPPDESAVLAKMREIFGENLVGVESILGLVGSGSVNYIVLSDLRDPVTGIVERAVVRILKEGVEGQVQNESDVWVKVVKDMRQEGTRPMRRAASMLYELQAQTMATLQPGGPEFDQSLERSAEHVEHSKAAYATDTANRETGYRTGIPEVLSNLQAIVPKALQKTVSIYRYIPNKRIEEFDRKVGKGLAVQMVDREIRANFEASHSDGDGHLRNWLANENDKVLVRIDTAQLKKNEDPQGRRAFKRVVSAIIEPSRNFAQLADALTRDFAKFFDSTYISPTLREDILRVISDRRFPSYRQPQERIFTLRENLEELWDERQSVDAPEVIMRLQPTARHLLSVVGKTLMFRDVTGFSAHSKVLVKRLDPERSWTSYWRAVLLHEVAQLPRTILESCVGRVAAGGEKVETK